MHRLALADLIIDVLHCSYDPGDASMLGDGASDARHRAHPTIRTTHPKIDQVGHPPHDGRPHAPGNLRTGFAFVERDRLIHPRPGPRLNTHHPARLAGPDLLHHVDRHLPPPGGQHVGRRLEHRPPARPSARRPSNPPAPTPPRRTPRCRRQQPDQLWMSVCALSLTFEAHKHRQVDLG
jgi:hypothetical protein